MRFTSRETQAPIKLSKWDFLWDWKQQLWYILCQLYALCFTFLLGIQRLIYGSHRTACIKCKLFKAFLIEMRSKLKINSNDWNGHFLCPPYRSPFLAKTTLGFSFTLIFSVNAAFSFVLAITSFTTIYVSISTNIECFLDDISTNVAHLKLDINRVTSIKSELKQFIDLHLHCYKYDNNECFMKSLWAK